MTMTHEERNRRLAAMTQEVRRRLLAQCQGDADAELIDTAASNLVTLSFLDAGMTHAGRRLDDDGEAQYRTAFYLATEALDMLGISNPFQPPSPH
jgi:hypothetical protein